MLVHFLLLLCAHKEVGYKERKIKKESAISNLRSRRILRLILMVINYRSKVYLRSAPVCACLIQCPHRALNATREERAGAWLGASRTCESVRCDSNAKIHRSAIKAACLPTPLPRYTLFACDESTYVIRNKQSVQELWFLANEWLGTMASRVRKPLLFCETNSTPQRPIVPHEICVKNYRKHDDYLLRISNILLTE